MIEANRDPDLNLTTFTCTGTPTGEDIAAELAGFYSGAPTLHTIWNYTGADLSALTAGKISELARMLKETAHSRAGGRAALVFTVAQLQSISDRLDRLAELEIEKAAIKIFSDMEKARAWVSA
jgi:hypothetical protein